MFFPSQILAPLPTISRQAGEAPFGGQTGQGLKLPTFIAHTPPCLLPPVSTSGRDVGSNCRGAGLPSILHRALGPQVCSSPCGVNQPGKASSGTRGIGRNSKSWQEADLVGQ